VPRISCIAGAASAILAAAPVSTLTLWLLLLLAIEGCLIRALLRGRRRPAAAAMPVIVIDGGAAVQLLRRTEPQLRARRPFGVVEQQVRWRQAAEAYRRRRADAV
jgi:hypothetical protein